MPYEGLLNSYAACSVYTGVGFEAEGSGAGDPRFLKRRPSAPHSGPCDVAGPILTNSSEVRATSIFAYSRKNFTGCRVLHQGTRVLPRTYPLSEIFG